MLKINILDRTGDFSQVESVMRKLVTLHPEQPAFRSQLIRFYVNHKRPDDAVKELRTAVTANPADVEAELQLVNTRTGALHGAPAARAGLVARINAGGAIFPYQIALSKLDFAQGNTTDSTNLLEKLIASSSSADGVILPRLRWPKCT